MPLLPTFLRNLLPSRRKALNMVPSGGGRGWFSVHEPFAGAWQRNMEINPNLVSTFHADFACKTLIARDIAKLPLALIERDADGIWTEVEKGNPAYSPVLRKPNPYQTRNQFWESWILSKLSKGNTYVLKGRDARRVVNALYVLDPTRVWPLIAEDGSVFYRVSVDELNGRKVEETIPATEIIHDRMNTMFHPLVGIPPIYASGLAAMQGLNIQGQSIRLFANNSQPGGILTAPGKIENDTATRLKETWEANQGGSNVGRLAVLGDGLKYEKLSWSADEAQLVEQHKLTAEIVASTYHVPAFMIGAGPEPGPGSAQERTLRYYTTCLQSLIEDAEAVLDDGLGLGDQWNLKVRFDIDALLRMDSVAQADVVTKLVGGSLLAPNEGRRRFNEKPLRGGDSIYMQQQNYSLEALAKRDAGADPFATAAPPAAKPEAEEPEDPEMNDEDAKAMLAWLLEKKLGALALQRA